MSFKLAFNPRGELLPAATENLQEAFGVKDAPGAAMLLPLNLQILPAPLGRIRGYRNWTRRF
jgi:hypothetical protein